MIMRGLDGRTSDLISKDITKIDKTNPNITLNNSRLIFTLDESNNIKDLITVSDNESGIDDTGLQIYRYEIATSQRTDLITNANYFTYPGLYAISLIVSDKTGNKTNINSEILVRWPTGGKYIVKKTILDGANIAGEGLSTSSIPDGLYRDNQSTGANLGLDFASKYYYSGANVDNYLSFAGDTYRIINIASNDDLKVLGAISDLTVSIGNSKIFNSTVYNTWNTQWWPNGQIYNNASGESKYKLFTETEKAHLDLATFYAGRVDKGDDILTVINNERTNSSNTGAESASFTGYSAYPNASDMLKASKIHDVVTSINDIDTASVQSRRKQFTNNSWVDMTAEFWTMNGRTGTLLQNNDFWVIDNDLGGHFESRLYSSSRQYRAVFYITSNTILSGNGTSSSPYRVQENWTWFDNSQTLQ